MNSVNKDIVEFALSTLVRFVELEGLDVIDLVNKHSGKVLGNEQGYDEGFGPQDKSKALDIIKSYSSSN
ncbi:hypothetical protein DLE54_11650 (plasmid) [Psychrobacter sp. YP14]|uniref:hypothetical protein n=1 Tax=Psychrobacter sp. YP14 TaxID=2203895 RepID=UPI000D7E4F79|nr:hypothetical protein [Psychrobacter sp. YP14]AWT50279.1 hypothetical protein DLE54_11650 [Psychrobacter sp. YP14]